uniref:Androgen dependent TFPI regulating protein n=1 Tax=Zosterops lateralis melanops TaxID=1220523 RepID=A0A8D2NMB1_ZOSLA
MEISTLATYHCLAFVWYFFVAYSITHIKTEERPSEVFLYGGQWKYLTVLNLVLQAVFYGVSFLADVLRLIKKLRCAKPVISSRDLLFSVLAFPVSTFVCISFWTLYTYNRELVYPKSLDGVIPFWLNHAMPVLITQPLRVLTKGNFSPSLPRVLWIYSVTGEWVYPLFALFSPPGLAAFFAASLAIIVSFYNFGEFLNRMIWGQSKLSSLLICI